RAPVNVHIALHDALPFLAEIPRVRRELGYPPLVTPTSQIVGSQAAIHVLSGARHASLSNEVCRYLRGDYGTPPGEVCPELRQRADRKSTRLKSSHVSISY